MLLCSEIKGAESASLFSHMHNVGFLLTRLIILHQLLFSYSAYLYVHAQV